MLAVLRLIRDGKRNKIASERSVLSGHADETIELSLNPKLIASFCKPAPPRLVSRFISHRGTMAFLLTSDFVSDCYSVARCGFNECRLHARGNSAAQAHERGLFYFYFFSLEVSRFQELEFRLIGGIQGRFG